MELNKTDKVAVLGSQGFLGQHICDVLANKCQLIVDNSKKIDYRDKTQTYRHFFLYQPDYVINCVGRNGNILFNKKYPALILQENNECINNILEACNAIKVKKVLSLVASCAYPESFGGDLYEADLLNGKPSDSVIGHAYAKRYVQISSWLYHRQYGLNAVTACPTTVFGPGDSIDLNRTKIINSLIVKFLKAGDSDIELGSPHAFRQFIYAKDAAQILTRLLLVYEDSSETINLASGPDIQIGNLAEKIYKICGCTGKIRYDENFPVGQLRKQLNFNKLKSYLPDFQFTDFDQALEETIKDVRMRLRNGRQL